MDFILPRRITYDIQFDDEETREAYEKHVQTFLDELPEFCKNGKIKLTHMFKIGDKEVTNQTIHNPEDTVENLLVYCVVPPIFYVMKMVGRYSDWVAPKLSNTIVIRKVISNRNLEAI